MSFVCARHGVVRAQEEHAQKLSDALEAQAEANARAAAKALEAVSVMKSRASQCNQCP